MKGCGWLVSHIFGGWIMDLRRLQQLERKVDRIETQLRRGDYSWPGFVDVDPTGQYPGSYPSITAALATAPIGFMHRIRLFGHLSENITISSRIEIHGVAPGEVLGIPSDPFPLYSTLTGNVTLTSTGDLTLYNMYLIGSASISGMFGCPMKLVNCRWSGTYNNNTTISLLHLINSQMSSSSSSAPIITVGSSSLSIKNSTIIKPMTGSNPMIACEGAAFEMSNSMFIKNGAGTGPALDLTATPNAASYIQYCNFSLAAGTTSVTSVTWNPARFFFNHANVAFSANITPAGTAVNSVG